MDVLPSCVQLYNCLCLSGVYVFSFVFNTWSKKKKNGRFYWLAFIFLYCFSRNPFCCSCFCLFFRPLTNVGLDLFLVSVSQKDDNFSDAIRNAVRFSTHHDRHEKESHHVGELHVGQNAKVIHQRVGCTTCQLFSTTLSGIGVCFSLSPSIYLSIFFPF